MKRMIRTVFAAICFALFAFGISSCEKDAGQIDKSRECVVSFITNIDPDGTSNTQYDTLWVNVRPGEFIEQVPVLEKEGHYLEGWYTDATVAKTGKGTAPRIPAYDLTTKPIYLDVFLYGRWLPIN